MKFVLSKQLFLEFKVGLYLELYKTPVDLR